MVADFALTAGMHPIGRNNKHQKDDDSNYNQASFSGASLLCFQYILLALL